MEKDYIGIYNIAYSKEEKEYEKRIKKELISYKDNMRSFNYALNTITKEFNDYRGDHVMINEYKTLHFAYQKRLEEFAVEFQMQVIPQTLLKIFHQVEHSNKEYSFEDCITDLATFNAHEDTYHGFRNNSPLYELMFKLNDFSEFSIKYCEGGYGSEMHEKYRVRIYGKPCDLGLRIKLPVDAQINCPDDFEAVENESKEGACKNFQLHERYFVFFEKDDFYSSLTYDFIDPDKTSEEDFKNVFTKDFDSHKSVVFFSCDNPRASYLLSELQKRFQGKLSQTNIALSKKFKSRNDTFFSQSTLSRAKKITSEEDRKIVHEALEFFF